MSTLQLNRVEAEVRKEVRSELDKKMIQGDSKPKDEEPLQMQLQDKEEEVVVVVKAKSEERSKLKTLN